MLFTGIFTKTSATFKAQTPALAISTTSTNLIEKAGMACLL